MNNEKVNKLILEINQYFYRGACFLDKDKKKSFNLDNAVSLVDKFVEGFIENITCYYNNNYEYTYKNSQNNKYPQIFLIHLNKDNYRLTVELDEENQFINIQKEKNKIMIHFTSNFQNFYQYHDFEKEIDFKSTFESRSISIVINNDVSVQASLGNWRNYQKSDTIDRSSLRVILNGIKISKKNQKDNIFKIETKNKKVIDNVTLDINQPEYLEISTKSTLNKLVFTQNDFSIHPSFSDKKLPDLTKKSYEQAEIILKELNDINHLTNDIKDGFLAFSKKELQQHISEKKVAVDFLINNKRILNFINQLDELHLHQYINHTSFSEINKSIQLDILLELYDTYQQAVLQKNKIKNKL